VEFVQKNRDTLERLPSAFFSVSLAAHGDTEEAEGYVERFEQETGWRPARVALFGGALLAGEAAFVGLSAERSRCTMAQFLPDPVSAVDVTEVEAEVLDAFSAAATGSDRGPVRTGRVALPHRIHPVGRWNHKPSGRSAR